MFEKFGEFDSAEELNRAAAAQKAEGDREALVALALENGLDREDVEDYLDGVMEMLATPVMAATGKLKKEAEELKPGGILEDWKNVIMEMCMDDRTMQAAVRKKGKYLKDCMAALLKYAFENKVQVPDEVVRATKVIRNGKEEPMRGPVYMGVPDRRETREIIRNYYVAGEAKK